MEFKDQGGDSQKAKRGRKPGRRRRTPTEMARDAREIARLRLRYHLWTHGDIAENINARFYADRTPDAEGKEPPLIGNVQVCNIIKTFEARLEAEAVGDVLALRRLRIAEYRDLEAFCYERYNATVGEHTKTIDKEGETTTTREELSGELGYLRLAEACKAKISELENIIPPKKVAPTNPDGTKPYDAFSDNEELKRLVAVFDGIAKGKGGMASFGGE